MHYLYAFIALDIADARTREAREAHRYDGYLDARSERPSAVRRGLAHGLAAISRGSAAATRRLDDVVADDLGRALATNE